ncbi:MAG: hypothetical protein HY868_19995 [Chloroflexi bacterium]|nr:hypothetical protein [Chloroflexota bacterium]
MSRVTEDIAIAQLAIADGGWQESPDQIAQFDEVALFGTRTGRGRMFAVAQVEGETEGRDEIARELIEAARREYGASRGSIMLALRQAVRVANDTLYNLNANLAPDARRIAGMTIAILREHEIFIAQAGPGLACVQRVRQFRRYPDGSPWFEADDAKLGEWLAARNFPTPGSAPLGFRREYMADTFRVALQPGDGIILSTRTLAYLLSNDEVLDTLAEHHPDEIVSSLEDLAGAADLAVIVIRLPGENLNPLPLHPPTDEEPSETEAPEPELAIPALDSLDIPTALEASTLSELEPVPEPAPAPEPVPPPREETPAREPIARPPRPPLDLAPARNAMLRGGATFTAVLAAIFTRVNWQGIGAGIDRAITIFLRGIVQFLILFFGRVSPGEPKPGAGRGAATGASPQPAWQVAALVLPLLVIGFGGWTWASYRATQVRLQNEQIASWVKDAAKAFENGRVLTRTDRVAAREQFLGALKLTDQVKALNASHPEARKIANDTQDELDKLNGVQVLFPVSFATFAEPKANVTRVLTRSPDVFILDRGLQRVYRYTFNDTGVTLTPVAPDGIILKAGDKVDSRTIGEMVDMTLIDAGRLVVIDRGGAFLQYDPARSQWSSRTATDATQWKNVTLVGSFSGNLYLADAGRNQIMKYTAATEGVWTAATTYFATDVRADLTNVADMVLDENVYLLRGNGEIFRYTSGKPNDLRLRELEVPFKNPVAIVTGASMNGLYIADAGNQRIVQIDKGNGRFVRQFKPSNQVRETFASLRTLTADEANRRFIFINGNQAYFAAIPQ